MTPNLPCYHIKNTIKPRLNVNGHMIVQNIEWNFNNQNNLYSDEHPILTQQFSVKFVNDLQQVGGFL